MFWLPILLLSLLVAFLCARYMSSRYDTFRKLNIDSSPSSWIPKNFVRALRLGIFKTQVELYNRYKHKKVFGIYEIGTPILVIRDLDMIKDIMVKSFSSFPNRRVFLEVEAQYQENLLQMKGEQWKHVRNIVSPTFSSGRIKRMSQFIEGSARNLVDALRQKQEMNANIDLKDVMSNYALDVIASSGFGLQVNTLENPDNQFAVNAKKITHGFTLSLLMFFITPWLVRLMSMADLSMYPKKSLNYFTNVIDSAMENRKEEGRAGKVNDFMDLLINADKEAGQPEGRSLTRREINGQVLVFIIAGYDSVSSVLSFMFFMLANHPEYCQLVQKEIDEKLGNESPNYDNVQGLTYMEMCINETMRIFPLAFVLQRICTEDITLQGIHIPKGMAVSAPVYAIHHDPEIWPEPEKFQPDRFSAENKDSRHPFAFLPFGHGPRNCVGLRLAYLDMKLALAYVLKTFTPVPCEKTVYPIKLYRFQMSAGDGLWIKLEKRKK